MTLRGPWRAKRFGPRITRAHWRLHFGLVREGIRHFLNYQLQGKTQLWEVDVYIPPWLVVEADGSSHMGEQLKKDAFKTQDLEAAELPFMVLRFWDHTIFGDLPSVLAIIKKVLSDKRAREGGPEPFSS